MALFISAMLKRGIFAGSRDRIVTSDIPFSRSVHVLRGDATSVLVLWLSWGAFWNIIIFIMINLK